MTELSTWKTTSTPVNCFSDPEQLLVAEMYGLLKPGQSTLSLILENCVAVHLK